MELKLQENAKAIDYYNFFKSLEERYEIIKSKEFDEEFKSYFKKESL